MVGYQVQLEPIAEKLNHSFPVFFRKEIANKLCEKRELYLYLGGISIF